jgi:inorganic pyrophosphatase
MNLYHSIAPRFSQTSKLPSTPYALNVVVETPKGARHKFALNEEYGVFEWSRTLPAGLMWPCDFGFVPQTLADDGDPLDVCVLVEQGTFPGCLVATRVVGVLGYIKNGVTNDRLIAVPVTKAGAGSHWSEVEDIGDLSDRILREIEDFLLGYNRFEGHDVRVTGRFGRDYANELVERAVQAHKNQHG